MTTLPFHLFVIIFLDPYFQACNSVNIWNILMILGGIIEQIDTKCCLSVYFAYLVWKATVPQKLFIDLRIISNVIKWLKQRYISRMPAFEMFPWFHAAGKPVFVEFLRVLSLCKFLSFGFIPAYSMQSGYQWISDVRNTQTFKPMSFISFKTLSKSEVQIKIIWPWYCWSRTFCSDTRPTRSGPSFLCIRMDLTRKF